MMANPLLSKFLDALWSTDLSRSYRVWAVLDAARDKRIYPAVVGSYMDHCCLYSGQLPLELMLAAPYMIELDAEARITHYIFKNGWGNSWGIFLRSGASMDDLRRHLKKLLVVKDRKGRRLLFRFYDPRVLRVYLPTCRPKELETVFGPAKCYMAEGEDPETILRYRFDEERLIESSVRLSSEALRAG